MNIPQEANPSEVYDYKRYICPDCLDMLACSLDDDMFVGRCSCERVWYIPVEKKAAYCLTQQQVARIQREEKKPTTLDATLRKVREQQEAPKEAPQQEVPSEPVPAGQ